jgi:hypothetical protein
MSIIGLFFGLIDRQPNVGDKTMSASEQLRPMLPARAATDPKPERLLEMFDKAAERMSVLHTNTERLRFRTLKFLK